MLELFVAVLLAFAFFCLGIVITKGLKYNHGIGLTIFSIGLILLSGLILIWSFGIGLLIQKLIGLGFVVFGFFMTVKFPQPGGYQPEGFSRLGLLLGLFCLFVGIYWLLF